MVVERRPCFLLPKWFALWFSAKFICFLSIDLISRFLVLLIMVTGDYDLVIFSK